MNESSQVPPRIPTPEFSQASPPLGDDPAEQIAITGFVAVIDAVLRQPRRLMFQLRQPNAGRLIAKILLIAALCSVMYGVVVGTFSGGSQLWIAPVKIVAGLMLSAIICLPSLYIFTCLSGSQAKLAEVFGLLAGLLMLMTILLVAFTPVAWIFSQSTESIAWMGAMHLVFTFIAIIFGLRFLETGFSHSNARTKFGLNSWAIVFVLVILQMTTALRPILGKADTFFPTEKKFFFSHWIDCLKPAPGESHYRN